MSKGKRTKGFRKMFDYKKLYNEITDSLDDPSEFDVDGILDEIVSAEHGISSIDDIDTDAYWEIVSKHCVCE